ncbi:hypothetical protein [Streptomyces sp. NPDC001492]
MPRERITLSAEQKQAGLAEVMRQLATRTPQEVDRLRKEAYAAQEGYAAAAAARELLERGDVALAQRWLRTAVTSGVPGAAHAYLELLQQMLLDNSIDMDTRREIIRELMRVLPVPGISNEDVLHTVQEAIGVLVLLHAEQADWMSTLVSRAVDKALSRHVE